MPVFTARIIDRDNHRCHPSCVRKESQKERSHNKTPMEAVAGFEPTMPESKSDVLPLHYTAIISHHRA